MHSEWKKSSYYLNIHDKHVQTSLTENAIKFFKFTFWLHLVCILHPLVMTISDAYDSLQPTP